ncbi:MAG: CatB-related O-acetyltransferase [Solirubrobacterales bacterium]
MKRFVRRLLGLKPREKKLPDHIRVGRGTYGVSRAMFHGISPKVPVEIGNFCSIAHDARIFCLVGHPTDLPTTYPLRTLLLHPDKGNQDAVARGPVRIGHDVWIGSEAVIMDGVTIGNGAVVAARAVVTKDVPPYAIVGGNPARVIRHRFAPEIVAALLEIEWWFWPDERIREFESFFYGDVESFVAAAQRLDSGRRQGEVASPKMQESVDA